MIKKSDLPIKAPKVISSFEHEDKTVVILERVNAPLYGSIIKEHKNNFIKPLINQLNIIHQIKREKAGLVTDVIENKGNTWKELLLNKYSGKHSYYPWDEVKNREGVDADLLDKALEYLKSEIAKIDELSEYNLLHTDVNQNNIFLNIKNNEVESIIDWSESIFGDPIYDFARFRLNMWHNFNDEAFGIYFDVLNLSEKDLQKEKLYFLCHVIDYINWYSEFGNLDRVRMHQEYLGGICNK